MFVAANFISTLPAPKLLIAMVILAFLRSNPLAAAFACCGLHQSADEDFIAIAEDANLLFVYLLHLMGDHHQQRNYSQFASAWHGDCL
jgi:hypothetical protein